MTPSSRILLVEDDRAHAALIRRAFESRPEMELEIAGSLSEARAMIGRREPLLAITDLLLPDGRGVELLAGAAAGVRFPVVIMTSHGDENVAVEAMKAGALDYVVKSEITLATMPQVVERALREWNHIQERRRVEDALQASEQRYRALYDDNPSIFFTLDLRGIVVSVNQFGAESLGYRVVDLVGRPFSELCVSDEGEIVQEWIASCFEEPDQVHRWESCQRRRDGSEIWVRTAARVGQETTPSLLVVCEDVTEVKTLSERLSYEANHDTLTQLMNRRGFERKLVQLLGRAKITESSHALCYLDLDQFKVINDNWGHRAGDDLLRQIGKVLRRFVRSRDTLARLGGDEFGVLLENTTVQQALRVANTLHEAIEGHRFVWEGEETSVAASIAIVPITPESGSITDVMSAADTACYAAKDAGRNNIQIWHPEDDLIAERQGQTAWVPRIQTALNRGDFRLYQQTIMPLNGSGRGSHFEILLRLQNPGGQMVSPGEFLPAAERFQLMRRIDQWVIRSSFRWLADHQARLVDFSFCSLNLAGETLGTPAGLQFILDELETTGVSPKTICFEVTETGAIQNLASAARFIGRLRDLGCHFALDDFGTGLSSFSYLKTLPVDYIKIDGMFVRDILHDPVDMVVVRSINEIAHAMGVRTVAEFVESDQVLEKLREIGVDFVQGYAVAGPMPLDSLLDRGAEPANTH